MGETLTKNIEVVRGTPHFVAETEEALSRLRELPLPVQVVLRALQHFADKASDSADIYITYYDSNTYLRVATKKSVFLFEQIHENTYLLYFERQRGATELIKKVLIHCDEETAKKIVKVLYSVFEDAVENGNIDVRPVVELFCIEAQQQPQPQ